MIPIRHAAVGLFSLTITASGLAMADCPKNLPTQLLEDCLIYNSEGESFPADDYAHMDEYQAWLKAQPEESQPSNTNVASRMHLHKPADFSTVQP
jgi:hypothetical protein